METTIQAESLDNLVEEIQVTYDIDPKTLWTLMGRVLYAKYETIGKDHIEIADYIKLKLTEISDDGT